MASLRRVVGEATGHVGDHDAGQVVADELVLFPADRVLVFAHPRDAAPASRLSSRTSRAGRYRSTDPAPWASTYRVKARGVAGGNWRGSVGSLTQGPTPKEDVWSSEF